MSSFGIPAVGKGVLVRGVLIVRVRVSSVCGVLSATGVVLFAPTLFLFYTMPRKKAPAVAES